MKVKSEKVFINTYIPKKITITFENAEEENLWKDMLNFISIAYSSDCSRFGCDYRFSTFLTNLINNS